MREKRTVKANDRRRAAKVWQFDVYMEPIALPSKGHLGPVGDGTIRFQVNGLGVTMGEARRDARRQARRMLAYISLELFPVKATQAR